MIRVNLLPVKELRAEVSRRRDLTVGGIVLGFAALVFIGLYLYQVYRLSQLHSELTSLRSEIQALNIKVKQVGELQNRIKEFTSKNKIIADLDGKKIGPVRVMETLSAATPSSLWLTEFKDTNGKLVINGLALDNQTIAEFLKALAAASYFRDVELVETTQPGPAVGPYKKFSIKTNLSYQPVPPAGSTKAQGSAPAKQEKKG